MRRFFDGLGIGVAAVASFANFALVIGMFVVLPVVGSAVLLYRWLT